MNVLCVYKSGKTHWVDGTTNPKLRGVKIMGERPSTIYLHKPSEELVKSAVLSMHPGYGTVVVNDHG